MSFSDFKIVYNRIRQLYSPHFRQAFQSKYHLFFNGLRTMTTTENEASRITGRFNFIFTKPPRRQWRKLVEIRLASSFDGYSKHASARYSSRITHARVRTTNVMESNLGFQNRFGNYCRNTYN